MSYQNEILLTFLQAQLETESHVYGKIQSWQITEQGGPARAFGLLMKTIQEERIRVITEQIRALKVKAVTS